MNENKLKQILKKANAIPGLDNVINEIRQALQEEDPEIYEAWNKGKIDTKSIHFDYTISKRFLFPGQAPSRNICLHLLEIAITEDLSQVVEALMEAGADIIDVEHRLTNGHRFDDIKKEEELQKQRDDNVDVVKRKNINGSTALHIAAQNGSIKTAEYLISKGAEVDVQDNYGNPPLFYALKKGDREMVQYLLRKGAGFGEENVSSLFDYAIKNQKVTMLEIMLEEGCNHFVGLTRLQHIYQENNFSNIVPYSVAESTLKSHISIKLFNDILWRESEFLNKYLNNARSNHTIAETLPRTLTLFMTQKQVAELSEKDNKDIVKAIQQNQVMVLSVSSIIAVVLGLSGAGAAIFFGSPITAIVIGAIATTVALPTAGYAAYHGLNEIPSTQLNGPAPAGATPVLERP